MLGIWFNHADLPVRRKQEDFESLKRFGFTDAFVMFKGCFTDQRDTPADHEYLDFLIKGIRQTGVRVHGVFFGSVDKKYTDLNPERADIPIFGKSDTYKICHLDKAYIEYLNHSIMTAAAEYALDGIQLDYVRFGTIFNGWSPEEEKIYSDFGVNVPALKDEILNVYDLSKPSYNLKPILSRYTENDGQMLAFAAGRQSIIRNFVKTVSENIRSGLPDAELSVAMMPEGMYPPWAVDSALHYGQNYEDFLPYFDYLIPMIYASAFNRTSEWVGEVATTVCERYPKSVIGIDTLEPRSGKELSVEIEAIKRLNHAGLAVFRYGRMLLATRDGHDTLLYNTYPGTVTRLVLIRGEKEVVKDCILEEASWMKLSGQWDRIRAFGKFFSGKTQTYEGEMSVLDREML